MHTRWAVLLALVLGCADPSQPASSKAGALTESWLEDLSHGRDVEAFATYSDPSAPADFTAIKLGKRADRTGILRTAESIEITRVHYRESTYWDPLGSRMIRFLQNLQKTAEVTAVLKHGPQTVTVKLEVVDGGIRRVQVGAASLLPVHNTQVIPAPPALKIALATRNLSIRWFTAGDSAFIGLTTDAQVAKIRPGLRLETLCQEGDRFYRHATESSAELPGTGWQTLTLSSRVGDQRLHQCQVAFEVLDGDRRRLVRCLTGDVVKDGTCPKPPNPAAVSALPVQIDELWAGLNPDQPEGLTVHYTLHPNLDLPMPGTVAWAALRTELTCDDGATLTHNRPLNGRDHQMGVHRRLGAVFLEKQPRVQPCSVRLGFHSDDDYDRLDVDLFDGCLANDTLRPGPCERQSEN